MLDLIAIVDRRSLPPITGPLSSTCPPFSLLYWQPILIKSPAAGISVRLFHLYVRHSSGEWTSRVVPGKWLTKRSYYFLVSSSRVKMRSHQLWLYWEFHRQPTQPWAGCL